MSDWRTASRVYQALLVLLPRRFRDRHGEEMRRAFDELWTTRAGPLDSARLLARAAADVAWWGWKARGARRPDRGSAPGPETGHDGRGGILMDDLIQDVRYAARQLARRPGFAAVLALTLGLGIGANTAVFSVVDAVLLRPLPYPEPERLAVLWTRFPTMDLQEFWSSWPEYRDYREESRSFEELGFWGRSQRTLTGADDPERLAVAYLSWTMFPVLDVEPALGRAFDAEEDVAGNDDVILLSDGLWTRRFGSDPSVVGRTVELDGAPVTVLGVMPPGFAFPDRETQAWIPAGIDPGDPPGRASHFASVVGRLSPGVTLEEASAELGGLVRRWQDDPALEHTWHAEFHPAYLRPLHEDVVGDVRASLVVVMGAVGLVLLIACANVANLLLVRGEGRLRELSVRAALGAGRRRIVRQLLTENLLVAAVGGAFGLILARVGLEGLLALAPADLPRLDGVGVNGSVLAFSAVTALCSGVLFGLAPALRTLRVDVRAALGSEGRAGTAGRGRNRLQGLLVVGQTALAVVVLVAAGLLAQSFLRLSAVDPGFRGEDVLALSVSLPEADYPEDADVTGFYGELLSRLGAIAGVRAAGMVRTLPLTGSLPPNDIEIESQPRTESDGPPFNADIQMVSAGYFDAMGVPLLAGRGFERADDERSEAVAVVDEVLARRFFDDPAAALGERIRQRGDEYDWARIAGVVGAVRQEGLDREPRATLYVLHAQGARAWSTERDMTLVLRAGSDPAVAAATVRREVRALDAALPVYRVTTLGATVATATARQRFTTLLQLVFAGLAVTLAAVGIYGVLSYTVARRTREIGIRMALGARREAILRLVVRRGMEMVAGALVLGTAGALASGRLVASLLYEVSPRDPLTYAAVLATLAAVAFLACWIPARRASAVSPQRALRQE